MTVAIHRSAALWIALFMLVGVGAQAAEPDFTFRVPVETRDIPDVITTLSVLCAIYDAKMRRLDFNNVEFSGPEIAKSVIVEVTFRDRAKVGLAKSWECYLFLIRADGHGGIPLEPGETCDQENIWYLCGRDGEPFRKSVSGLIE